MKQVITNFDSSFNIINPKDGTITEPFRIWMLQVIKNGLLIGSGSPNGVLEAQQGVFYMDEDGAASNVLYIKQQADISGDRTLGWMLIG